MSGGNICIFPRIMLTYYQGIYIFLSKSERIDMGRRNWDYIKGQAAQAIEKNVLNKFFFDFLC